MRLPDSNPGNLVINPEKEIIWRTKSLETAKASDEEYQEVNCPPVVESISERNAKYTKVLQSRMADGCLIATLILLSRF